MYSRKAAKNNERFLIDIDLIRSKLLREQKDQIDLILVKFLRDKDKHEAITNLDKVRDILMTLYVQLTGTTNL